MSKRKSVENTTTLQIRLHPTREQVALLQAHCADYQLTQFITYKAQRIGITVQQVDPAYTSQECPACTARNKAQDRTYVCVDCGWMGHRDNVGAINISRRAGLADKR